MTWVLRTVAAVFGVGVLALLGVIVVLLRDATGVPPLPVLLGVLGLVALILLSGGCLALISIAVSLRRIAAAKPSIVTAVPAPTTARVFTPSPLQTVTKSEPEPEPAITAPTRPARPAGRTLVAER